MAASEYIFPGLILLGGCFFFLEMASGLQQKRELSNPYAVLSFIDIAKFFFYGLSIFFLFMAIVFGRAVVDNSTANMAEVFNTVQVTFALSLFIMFVATTVYVFFVMPWIIKKQLERMKKFEKNSKFNGGFE